MNSTLLLGLSCLVENHEKGAAISGARICTELRAACEHVSADFDLDFFRLIQSYLVYFSKDPALQLEIEAIAVEFRSALERAYSKDPSNYSLLVTLGCLDLDNDNIRRARRRLEKVAQSGFSVSGFARSILESLDNPSQSVAITNEAHSTLTVSQSTHRRPLFAIVNEVPDDAQSTVIYALANYAEAQNCSLTLLSQAPDATRAALGGGAFLIEFATVRSLFNFFADDSDTQIQSAVFLSSPMQLASKAAIYGDGVIVDLRCCCADKPEVVSSTLAELVVDKPFSPPKTSFPKLSLITSIFQAHDFIQGFFQNITSLEWYADHFEHYFMFSDLSDIENDALFDHFDNYNNAIFVWHREDPGLYECWNIAARLANSPYLSNANVDDLRHPRQAKALIEALEQDDKASIAATALSPFECYSPDYFLIDTQNAWYANQAGPFQLTDLGRVSEEDGVPKLIPHCIPHCMPVWRRELHAQYGFFDEGTFGTYADWAFWLRVLRGDESGLLLADPLSFYFVNQNSHNRRGDKLQAFHDAVEAEFLGDFLSARPQPAQPGTVLSPFEQKLDLHGRNQQFGSHRNSFNMLIEALAPLDMGAGGIKFLPFIERTFVWGNEPGEAASNEPRPLTEEWIGVLHVPFDAPSWLNPAISPEEIFRTEMWRNSLPACRGIIGLSEDISKDFSYHYPEIPTLSVLHPTELTAQRFDFDRYKSEKRVVQAGDWLRKLRTVFQIKAPSHKKIMLLKNSTRSYLDKEESQFGKHSDVDVDVREFVDNDEYDELLSSSVIVCMLFGTAANNLVIECMARATPLIVNPLPSVVEYLGRGYPLYANTLEDVDKILRDEGAIMAAHLYLCERTPKTPISYNDFLQAIGQSGFYRQL